MIRMRVQGCRPKYFRIHFETGRERYRIEFDLAHGGLLTAARLLTRPDAKEGKAEAQRLTEDGGRWYSRRDGLLDLRYRDGRIVVARGPMVLMSFAVDAPPSHHNPNALLAY